MALWNLTLWKGNPMSPTTLDIQALINAGANLTIDAATYGQLERLGFVRLAANKKVQIVFTNAVKVSQLDRLALVNAAPGLVGLDSVESVEPHENPRGSTRVFCFWPSGPLGSSVGQGPRPRLVGSTIRRTESRAERTLEPTSANSLRKGGRGSFISPASRALGGKSGMTRAEPLVFTGSVLRAGVVPGRVFGAQSRDTSSGSARSR
ncbi:Uncharacterised protein [Pseudomonas aeruginosa]|nr:Uncharacterised protein [Pseudomonas aeruginosa]